MSRALVIACIVLAGCKSRGTIDLEFDLAPCPSDAGVDAAPGPDAGEYVIVYAKQQTKCSDCTCGACFGRRAPDASACTTRGDRCTLETVRAGLALALSPGAWAVVLERYTASGDRLFASQCIEVAVDSDGTGDRTATPMECEAACVTGSSAGPRP